jgi:hypothetical protein
LCIGYVLKRNYLDIWFLVNKQKQSQIENLFFSIKNMKAFPCSSVTYHYTARGFDRFHHEFQSFVTSSYFKKILSMTVKRALIITIILEFHCCCIFFWKIFHPQIAPSGYNKFPIFSDYIDLEFVFAVMFLCGIFYVLEMLS